jgi:DNA-binding MarR family transcriptional regulator
MDDLLLSKIRLSIIAALLSADWVAFSALLRATETTNGNLGAHLSKLVGAGYVREEKSFVDRRPQSRYALTETGRSAFVAHVRDLENLLGASGATEKKS